MEVQRMIKWIIQNPNIAAVCVAAISALIAALSAIVAFCANLQNRKQYEESIQPQLSMSLVEYNSYLYLKIKNTGKLPAKNVNISLISIQNNGDFNELEPDGLFDSEFELYSEESVQGRVALHGKSMVHDTFPQIEINVTYDNGISKKRCSYLRTVTYQSAYAEKIAADVNMDIHSIESSLGSIARANVRTANYLDGRQVGAFDERNILAQKSLKSDLLAVTGKPEEPSLTREETIDEAKNHSKQGGQTWPTNLN